MQEQLPAIQNIIVPLDGSDISDAALPIATTIAAATEAHIDLVTVALTDAVPLDSQMDSLTREALHRAEAAVRARNPRVGSTVLAGTPAEELSAHARKSDADIIVMATHGRSGIRRLILGSVADRLITLSPVPVLLIRAKGNGPVEIPLEEVRIKRVILPLDGSQPAPAAVPYALVMAKVLGAQALLLTADEGNGLDGATRQFRAFSDMFQEHGLTVTEVIEKGRPTDVITATAKADDLVVMSSLSATGIARGSHRGSVADHVVKNASAPVLIVAPRGFLGTAIQ